MRYTSTNTRAPLLVLAACSSLLLACGEDLGTGGPFSAGLVYCDNPAVDAPSCSLSGYSLADDSALRAKLQSCATAGCHGTEGVPATTWSIDLSGSVRDALSALTTFADESPYFLVDDFDPDCSQLLSEVTSKPVAAIRMPVTGGYWSTAETDCFRAYLHELYPQ